jgi:predicted dehydrogenase
MSTSKVRFGILSTAGIAHKNWKGILESGNSTVVAVASRKVEKARQFIEECQAQAPMEAVPRALGSYEELLAHPEVDALYIPLPTGLRKEWVMKAAAAGKHVLSEKPCAVSVADLNEMLEACERNRVQFLDGVMFMHSRRLPQIRAVLDDGSSVGELKRIYAAFSFCGGPEFLATNIRTQGGLEPAGCLGDLGWYCIRFALWVIGWRMPRAVTGRMLASQGGTGGDRGVPTEFSGEMFFEGGVSAGFYCSFLTGNQQCARVSGTLGTLEVLDFVLPYAGDRVSFTVQKGEFKANGCEFRLERKVQTHVVEEHSHGHPESQEVNMFRNFSEGVRSGKVNGAWREWALKTQRVVGACLESASGNGAVVTL